MKVGPTLVGPSGSGYKRGPLTMMYCNLDAI